MCNVIPLITKWLKANKGEDTAAESAPLCFCVIDPLFFKTLFPLNNATLFLLLLYLTIFLNIKKPLCPKELQSRVKEMAVEVYIL